MDTAGAPASLRGRAGASPPPGRAAHHGVVHAGRVASTLAPQIIAIGSSTGGPQALFRVLDGLKGHIAHLPIVITQHLPRAFTGLLAGQIQKVSGAPSAEGRDGEILRPGHVFVAPGGFHMEIGAADDVHRIRLTRDPPENFHRPSVEPMFRTVAECFGGSALAIMLTGMGTDGVVGAGRIAESGGTVIAQDEASSVVWGMPGAVASAGHCAEILPLDEIAPHVVATIGRAAA